jgi:FtsP/CotA-like multicopper oxidase with cupredoxin domain
MDIPIPPGGRAEFILETPSAGAKGEFLTYGVDTSPHTDEDDPNSSASAAATQGKGINLPDDDDYAPPRPLATIVSSFGTPFDAPPGTPQAPPGSEAANLSAAAISQPRISLSNARPARQRVFYFSERALDPQHPGVATEFYITEKGRQPHVFDPLAAPNIVVHSGDVEDWVIENRSQESHDFHIHQLHFLLLERDGAAAQENHLRDTVDVPYWDGLSTRYPRVKVRMDFRDPAIIGAIPYHCHILQHADRGMMGVVEVKPRVKKNIAKSLPPKH